MQRLLLICSLMSIPALASLNVEPLTRLIRSRTCLRELVQRPKGEVLVVVGLGSFGQDDSTGNLGAQLVERMSVALKSHHQQVRDSWLSYIAEDEAKAIEFAAETSNSMPQLNGRSVRFRVGGSFSAPRIDSGGERLLFVRPHYDISQAGYFVSELVTGAKLRSEQIVVLADDPTLPPNKIKLDFGGTEGVKDENLGLRSINTYLGHRRYIRIRIGVESEDKLSQQQMDRLFSLREVSGLLLLVNKLQQMLTAKEDLQPKLIEKIEGILEELNR